MRVLQWLHGLRHGQGTLFRADGEVYSGGWANGERHGAGVLSDAAGAQRRGWWKRGQLVASDGTGGGGADASGTPRAGSRMATGAEDDDDGDLPSVASLDGPSVNTAASVDFNAEIAL